MIMLIIILFIDLFLLNRFNYNDTYKQKFLNLFLIFNLIIILLSYFDSNLYKVSNKAYMFYLLYVLIICFTITIFSNKSKSANANLDELKSKLNYLTSTKYIKILSTFTFLLLLFYYYKFINFSKNIGDSSVIRSMYYTNFFKNNFEAYFYNLILGSLKSNISLLVAMQLSLNSKKNYFFYIGIIITILSSLIGNGRMSLFNFMLYAIIMYVTHANKKLKNIEFNKILKLVFLLVLVFFFSLIPLYNRLNYSNFWIAIPKLINIQFNSIVNYFIGGFRNLDIYLAKKFYTIKSYTYGRATFGGIDELLCLFLNFIGIRCNSYNGLVGNIMQNPNRIGINSYFNAFYTCIMNFYSDLGLFGIIIYSFLFGLVTILLFKKYQKKHKIFDLALLLYFLVNILISAVYRWYFQSASVTFTFFVIYFLSMKEDKIFKNTQINDN